MQMPCYGSLFFAIGSRRSPVLPGHGRGRRFFTIAAVPLLFAEAEAFPGG